MRNRHKEYKCTAGANLTIIWNKRKPVLLSLALKWVFLENHLVAFPEKADGCKAQMIKKIKISVQLRSHCCCWVLDGICKMKIYFFHTIFLSFGFLLEINNLIMADSWNQELEGSINGHMSTSILLLLSAETVFINELFLIVHKKTFYMNDLLPFKSTNQRKKINY